MSDINPALWWVLLGLLVLALVVWLLISRQNKLNEARRDARVLRERAQGGETYVADVEDQARQAQDQARQAQAQAHEAEEQARRARAEAQRLGAQADEAVSTARQHRDDITADYLRADEIDPDVDTPR